MRDLRAYRAFLERIGYLVPAPASVRATTANVDREIAEQAGPQLVVPRLEPRYALNAANARWGSLYDALYGTDAIPETDGAHETRRVQPTRGRARDRARARLSRRQLRRSPTARMPTPPLIACEHGRLVVDPKDGRTRACQSRAVRRLSRATPEAPSAILLKNHGLHFEIQIDAADPIGKTDAANVKDVLIEAALTTIIDCEDSVAAVDADDKVALYRNWLGLMKGDLAEEVTKGGKTFTRRLNADREYAKPDGGTLTLHGARSCSSATSAI